MASVLKLKTDIKKLKAAIASKATSGAIKTKLRGKLTSLENELDKLQPNKRKPKTTGPKNESALVRLAKKRRTNQGLSTSKSDIERDAIRPAKKAGKRISASGNTYYEYRDNRVDNRQPPKKYRKLDDGGMMAKGGKVGMYELMPYVSMGQMRSGAMSNLSSPSFKETTTFQGTQDEAIMKAKNMVDNSDGRITSVEVSIINPKATNVLKMTKKIEMVRGTKMDHGGYMASGGMFSTKEDNEVIDNTYKHELANNIYKTALNKEVNGFRLLKFAWDNEGTLLWENKQRPEISIYATPFYTPDNDINFEEFLDGKDQPIRREDKAYKLTGNIDKDTETYFNYLESKTKKYAKGKMADGGEIVTDAADVQKIKNSIQEGELILRAGKSYGRKLSAAELESVRKSVNNSRKKIGLGETQYASGGYMANGGSVKARLLQQERVRHSKPHIVVDNDKMVVVKEFKNYNSAMKFVYDYLDANEDKYGTLSVMPKESSYKDGYMAKGGYMADGGMVEKLRKEFSTKELDDNLMLDGYKTEVFDYSEEEEAKRWVKKNSKDNYVVPYENDDDNYIYVVVPKHKMADGGSIAKGNYEMLMSQAKEVMHHAEELMQVVKPNMDIEAWVVSKAERATTDLSDITHYLDGLKMAMGGMVKHNAHKVNG
jgi:hypothetical protein